MTTGARRGELCALRWEHVDLAQGTVTIRRAIAEEGTDTWEKDTKSHQKRRVTIDPVAMTALRGPGVTEVGGPSCSDLAKI